MYNRKPFDLQRALISWNWFLAAISTFTAVKGLAFLLDEYYHQELSTMLCFMPINNVTCKAATIHGIMFALSKVVELGDTAFIVLRKKPLIFLHWYHHVTVLLSPKEVANVSSQFPKGAGHVTHHRHTLENDQFLKVPNFQAKGWLVCRNEKCPCVCLSVRDCILTNTDLLVTVSLYASYCILFIWFFYRAYLGEGKGVKRRRLADITMKNLMGSEDKHQKTS
ncbi:unnamed protein product [Cyprideis torosa]|uniref:Elongation of very long chain fatty acids protein n=1 Tax=Cyprideis torosa TaxID=163714 RepID=A0A7R8W5S4_9CRUS|nr:unnamed protein product [Cyprideis torosa]CAG0883217.1 unnamed protein product [Cyprideis torosa]